MSVQTFLPNTHPSTNDDVSASTNLAKDEIRIMPTSMDLARPHSDKEMIEQALAEENTNHQHLIASSRDDLPKITVNGVMIDSKKLAQEIQYHQADSFDDALYAAAQALVIRELLRQAVIKETNIGEQQWNEDEEQAISQLLSCQVHAKQPDEDTCLTYFKQNSAQFVTPPVIKVQHILLACPPELGDERLQLKKQAYQLLEQISNSSQPDAEFIQLARQYSACPSKEQGGELGYLNKGDTVPEFENTVFKLPLGLAPSPIETRYGFHLVKVIERQEGQPLTFEEAFPMIANQLGQKAFHHALCDFLYTLVDNADIQGVEICLEQENIYRG